MGISEEPGFEEAGAKKRSTRPYRTGQGETEPRSSSQKMARRTSEPQAARPGVSL